MTRRSDRHAEAFEIHLTARELELLRSLNVPHPEGLLDDPVPDEYGLVLRMSRLDLEGLVGWVAAEANHTRAKRRADTLNEIADEMEAALAHGPLQAP